jgi:hypothetical protein
MPRRFHLLPPSAVLRAYRLSCVPLFIVFTIAKENDGDFSKEPNAEVRFKEVAQAHEALHTPDLRAAYDEERSRPPPRTGGRLFSGAGFGGGASRMGLRLGPLTWPVFGKSAYLFALRPIGT